jgi:hypothetical protein
LGEILGLPFKNEDKESKKCPQFAHIGNNLGDYEIVHCFRDENYFKNKYSEYEISKAPKSQPETNTSPNVPTDPETNTSLNVREASKSNTSEIVTPCSIDLNITVMKDPISRGRKSSGNSYSIGSRNW